MSNENNAGASRDSAPTSLTWVQKLAEAPCSSTTCEEGHWFDYPNQPCELCCGTEALVPDLRQECHGYQKWGRHFSHQTRNCEGCQGSGWTLIPEREQMGVLARVQDAFTLSRSYDDGQWIVTLPGQQWCGEGATPEEATAHAIYQSQGVD